MASLSWQDLDDISSFEACWKRLKSASVQSFAVSFETSRAHCVLDPTEQDVDALLTPQPVDGETYPQPTRWFNFWAGEKDANAIKAIAKRYGVSPRLTALLCSTQATAVNSSPIQQKHHSHTFQKRRNHASEQPNVDLEKAPNHPDPQPKHPATSSQAGGFGDVVDKLWHFCSVDQGPQYLYVGYNGLFTVPGVDAKLDGDPSKPAGLRIWTSLLLCNDGTVVSVFQKPPPGTSPEYIGSMRYNVMNIFRHLSKHASTAPADTLMHVSVRSTDDTDQDTTATAALLFYYLFDDWMTTFSLVTHRNNPYRAQLELLRQEMFETAAVGLIRSLDLLGRQLTVLKSMYQSYELIIHRLLGQSQKHFLETTLYEREAYARGRRYLAHLLEDCDAPTSSSTLHGRRSPPSQAPGVYLPMAAVVRFERLLDRIRMHALAEVEECLKQKESLVLMNFNLVALSESQSVEKLTRTTILLAKVTILFLPVSLMTGYFSIQISGIENLYDLRTYWLCFLVVVVLSTLGLICFSGLTEKVAGRITHKSLTRTFYEKLSRAKAKEP